MSCIGLLDTSAAESGITVSLNDTTLYTTTTNTNQSSTVSKNVYLEPNTLEYVHQPGQVGSTTGWTNQLTSVTGYYRVVYTVRCPSTYGMQLGYQGYLRLRSTLSLDLSSAIPTDTVPDTGYLTFGEPSVEGLLPDGVSAFSYAVTPVQVNYANRANLKHSFVFCSGLNFKDYIPFEDDYISFVVRVPFSINFYISEDYFAYNRLFISSLFAGKLVTNNLYNYVQTTTVESVTDSLWNIQNNQKIQNRTESEQLAEQKKQTEQQKGFFASVLDWFTGFPDMLKSIVVPSDDAFSSFMDGMKTFVNQKLGFLAYPFEIIGRLVNLIYVEGDTVLTFPGFSVMGHQVWDDIEYNLSDGLTPFKAFTDAVKLGMSVVLVGAFLMLCQRKFDEVLGGGSE